MTFIKNSLLAAAFLGLSAPVYAESLIERAEAGDPAANVELGRQLFFGDQVTQDFGAAFVLWNRAMGFGGRVAECQITRLGDTDTADGMFITGLAWQHGWCYIGAPEPVAGFRWLHRAGQAYVDQGQIDRAEYILSLLLGVSIRLRRPQLVRLQHRGLDQYSSVRARLFVHPCPQPLWQFHRAGRFLEQRRGRLPACPLS